MIACACADFPAFFLLVVHNVGNVEPSDARMYNWVSRTFFPYFFKKDLNFVFNFFFFNFLNFSDPIVEVNAVVRHFRQPKNLAINV